MRFYFTLLINSHSFENKTNSDLNNFFSQRVWKKIFEKVHEFLIYLIYKGFNSAFIQVFNYKRKKNTSTLILRIIKMCFVKSLYFNLGHCRRILMILNISSNIWIDKIHR